MKNSWGGQSSWLGVRGKGLSQQRAALASRRPGFTGNEQRPLTLNLALVAIQVEIVRKKN